MYIEKIIAFLCPSIVEEDVLPVMHFIASHNVGVTDCDKVYAISGV